MEVQFDSDDLEKLELEANFTAGYSQEIVSKFRQRMQHIRNAVDERDFYGMKSLHFEKLKGNRSHQHSMRLNKQWRLIIELDKDTKPTKIVVIGIEDYH